MGLDSEIVRFLVQSREWGVSFRTCLTLGRQSYFLSRSETRMVLREAGVNDRLREALAEMKSGEFSEPFWKALGAEQMDSMDASAYEGASLVHDLNVPVSPELEERYDVVFDGGTLEHVFNFPVALVNAMRMVRVGGHLVLATPTNNYCGHGFYQLSPELFFRVLSPRYGFEVREVVAVQYGLRRRWYRVSDPERVGARVALIGCRPVLLLVIARKVRPFSGMGEWPKQSDYAAIWRDSEGASRAGVNAAAEAGGAAVRARHWFLEAFPRTARLLESLVYSSWNRAYSLGNPRNFTPWSDRRSPR